MSEDRRSTAARWGAWASKIRWITDPRSEDRKYDAGIVLAVDDDELLHSLNSLRCDSFWVIAGLEDEGLVAVEWLKHGQDCGAESVQVLVCGFPPLVKSGLRAVLSHLEGVQFAEEAFTSTALDPSRSEAQVIIVDSHSEAPAGLFRLMGQGGAAPGIVVILDESAEPELLLEYLHAGVRGLLCRDSPTEELGPAIRAVTRGHVYISPPVARHVVDYLLHCAPSACRSRISLDRLTRRECETLDLVSAGLSNSEIAARLFVSEKTVKFHVSNVLRKMGLRSRVQAAVHRHRDTGRPLGLRSAGRDDG